MLTRISLIVAIVAALAVGALNFLKVRDEITTLIQQRDNYHGQRDQVQSELTQTNKVLVATQGTLKQTQQDLADAKAARDKAIAAADAQTKRAQDLSDKLGKTSQTLSDTQAKLEAYVATRLTPDQVMTMSKTLRNSQDALDVATQEKQILQHAVEHLKNELAKYVGTNAPITMRADLRGKVVVVDPKWEFVVLNIGDDQGVKQDGQMLVSRDGKLVAKIIVRSVQKDRSIANIVPGWQLGEVFEGDIVTPAYPSSGT
ncbi:MAG: hypothetical protein KGJ60_11730 [Verrucomicrobiota bacterium]|nr:hypothetical protein [Verrucomicrobiota bacterium]